MPAPQAEFAAALLDPARPVPAGLRAWNGSDPAPRFGVHRNNVIVSLVDALADSFPVVRRLVGDEFFVAMARAYVSAHPPRSPVLAEYGDGFADWLAVFEPAATLPYLTDMARLERARVRAFHAADAAAIEPATLAAALAHPERLGAARWRLHPSLAVIRSAHAVVSLWAAHQQDGDAAIAEVDLAVPESALVLRQGDAALVIPVAGPVASFVQALCDRRTLADALHAATPPGAPDFDLAGALTMLMRHAALVAWAAEGDPA